MTDKKRDIFDLLQRLNPLHRRKVALINDLFKMDNNLLIERIRHMTHHLDLIIKFEWREHKGQELRERLEHFLQEHELRKLPRDSTIDWSYTILKKYYTWYQDKKPQTGKSFISKHEDFWRLILERRSIRKWTSKEVSPELIDKMIMAATWAPSSCNRQAWKFTLVSKDKRHLLQHRVLEAAPIVILLSIDERPYFFHEKHAPALDVGFAAQNLLLAATSLGIGSCPVYFAYPYIQKVKKELGIENYRKIYLAVALGYAAESPDRPARPYPDAVINTT
ncbi:nitroreductase [Candidatus Woesearchaeota archaeon]|nr:nitroreductase [Candidatus Woesearchaeota archaeon]